MPLKTSRRRRRMLKSERKELEQHKFHLKKRKRSRRELSRNLVQRS